MILFLILIHKLNIKYGVLKLAFFLFQGIEDVKQSTQQEEQRENGGIKTADQKMEDILLNLEEEAKPKRIGVHHYFALYSILLFKLL